MLAATPPGRYVLIANNHCHRSLISIFQLFMAKLRSWLLSYQLHSSKLLRKVNIISGKVAAQCAHAACGGVEVAMKRKPDILKKWRNEGQAKVCIFSHI